MRLVPFVFETMETAVLTESRSGIYDNIKVSRAYTVLAVPCIFYFYWGNLTGRINMNIHLSSYDLLVEFIVKTVREKLFMLLQCMQLVKLQV